MLFKVDVITLIYLKTIQLTIYFNYYKYWRSFLALQKRSTARKAKDFSTKTKVRNSPGGGENKMGSSYPGKKDGGVKGR